MGFTVPFLHSLGDVIPPTEACLYGHINWFLVQAQQQSSMGLSQSFPSMRGGKARPQTGFHFRVQKRPCHGLCQGLVVHLWLRGLTWRVGMMLIQVARSSADTRRKGGMRIGTPDVSQSSASSSSSSAVFQVGMLFKFFNQWRSITCNRFVLNIVWGLHLQLQSHPPCSVTSSSSMSRQL